jgi:hypothetical protein
MANSLVGKSAWCLVWVAMASVAAAGQSAPKSAPLPKDPLELVTGHVFAIAEPSYRAAVTQLLARARESYALRSAGHGYDLKVAFTVHSDGQTEHDGDWAMEDIFDPNQGFRWTAKGPDSYAVTRISASGKLYGDDTSNYIPLRLHEARAALFDPIPSSQHVVRAAIRTSNVLYKGVQLTCVLLSAPGGAETAAPGRRWDETEECIDPQSGLLQVHSQVPGRYYAYDYSNGPQFAGHKLPRKVIVTEAGKTVTEITVQSLEEIAAADPILFEPTAEMQARGRPVGMEGAQKIFRIAGARPFALGAKVHAVCVFGVITPSGQLVEAHSLQPSDPNSRAAVEAAKQMSFAHAEPAGTSPKQHFVFVIEEFVSSHY